MLYTLIIQIKKVLNASNIKHLIVTEQKFVGFNNYNINSYYTIFIFKNQ